MIGLSETMIAILSSYLLITEILLIFIYLFFFYFSSYLMSIYNPWGYDRPWTSLYYMILPGFMPLVSSTSALSCRYNLTRLLGFPSWVYPRRFSPSRSCLLAHSISLSFAPSLPPIPVVFKKFKNGPTAFSFPSRSANHLLSTCGCQLIPSFSNSRTSFLLCFLHFRHRAYRCSTVCSAAPHHQHFGVSITPILTRKVPTAPCPTFSW